MLFLGRYWSLYCRLIRIALILAALGGISLLTLSMFELYQGYVELVLALAVFAPVGVIFLVNGIGVFFYFVLNLQQMLRVRGDSSTGAYVCNLALMATAFLLPAIFFLFLSLRCFLGFLET